MTEHERGVIGMGVGRHEYNAALREIYRRLDGVEAWQKDHDEDHETDDDERRDGRRWTVTQILTALGVATAVGAFWLNATGR